MRLLILCSLATCAAYPSNVSPQTHTYKTVGGLEIKADVYLPTDSKIRPAIIWMHGGSLISGSREDPTEVNRYIQAGIAVVSIDYRLAPETKLPDILQDVRDAYQWLRSKGPGLFRIDPDRIAMVGHSAGGYLALAGGFILEPRPKAIVSFYGYGDVSGGWCTRAVPLAPGKKRVSREEAFASVSPGRFRCRLPKRAISSRLT